VCKQASKSTHTPSFSPFWYFPPQGAGKQSVSPFLQANRREGGREGGKRDLHSSPFLSSFSFRLDVGGGGREGGIEGGGKRVLG